MCSSCNSVYDCFCSKFYAYMFSDYIGSIPKYVCIFMNKSLRNNMGTFIQEQSDHNSPAKIIFSDLNVPKISNKKWILPAVMVKPLECE